MGAADARALPRAIVETSLDDLRSDDVRFLQEASHHGPLHVRVPTDELVEKLTGAAPKFPLAERLFLAASIRWVASTEAVGRPLVGDLDGPRAAGSTIVALDEDEDPDLEIAATAAGMSYRSITREARAGFPMPDPGPPAPGTPGVIVTGCYDWLHSGHIRFFMDAAEYGALTVVVGSDRNVELLKGPGHPLQHQDERRYMAGAVKPVYQCLVSTGSGWMDAEPEIERVKPTYYVVNEDGDQPEKREFCEAHGLEYVVLKRVPHAGLPARSSTDLRGF